MNFGVKDLIDVLLVAFFLYQTYKLMKNSGTLAIFSGVVSFIVVWILVSQVLEMRLMGAILDKFISVGFLVLVILFQDEIRRFLVALGSHRGWKFLGKIFTKKSHENENEGKFIAPVVLACMNMAKKKTGALICIQQDVDLTVYEQAQGFQMMLDMGDTVEDIAEKSGFSATTVRRRVKLLELDKDKFKKSEERGVSLFEYMELDKLKSPERKNEMLDYIGTENFKYKLKQAINDEAAEARKALWVEQLSTFATQITDKTGYKRVNSFYTNGEVKVDRPEDADTIEYFFFVETWGYIVLMVKDEPTTLTPEEEAKEREEQLKQERKDAAVKALSEATARAYELRADFVATVSAAAIKKRLADIVALWAYAEYWDDTGWLTEEEIAQATGAETLAEDDEDGEDDAAFTLQAVTDAIGKTPEKALLRMIYARLGDGKSEGYFRSYWNSYTMKHEENEKLDRIYALLVKLGYEMSDDEKALQDGTHELFGEATDE